MTATVLEPTTEVELVDENTGIPPVLLDLMGRISMKPTFKSERGLLYSFRGKSPEPIDSYTAGKAIEYEVLVKPETVTFRSITQTTGINRHSKKQYRSWKTDRAITLSLRHERHGHRVLRIYEHITRTQKYNGSFTNATARFQDHFDPKFGTEVPDIFCVEDIKPEQQFLTEPSTHTVAMTFASWAFYQIFKELDPTNPAFNAESFTTTAAYPVLQLFPKSVFRVQALRNLLPKNFSLHSEPDVKKFIAKTFGEDGIRKDMVKAVVNTPDINSLFLAARLKHLFPLDWLRDLVKAPTEHVIFNPKLTYTEESTAGLIALLGSLTLPQRKRLLVEKLRAGDTNDIGSYLIRDTIRMFSALNPTQREEYQPRIDYSSWHTLHDTLVQINNELRAVEESERNYRPIEWAKGGYMAKLHETSYELDGETYHIFAPTNRLTLDRWGNEMHNCIGSYYSQVTDDRTNVFGVHHKGELFANVEISPGGVVLQYMKKYNSRVSEEHVTALAAHIKATDKAIAKKIADGKRISEAMKKRSIAA